MGKILLEPILWIALAAWAVFIFWSAKYIRAANRVVAWIDTNDRDLWVRMIWTNQGRLNSRYYNQIARRLELLVLFGDTPNLPSDAEFRAHLSNARWAIFFCFVFWTLAIVATGLCFHIIGI